MDYHHKRNFGCVVFGWLGKSIIFALDQQFVSQTADGFHLVGRVGYDSWSVKSFQKIRLRASKENPREDFFCGSYH